MTKVLYKKDLLAVVKETVFNNSSPNFTKLIQFVEENLTHKIEYVERNIVMDTFSAQKGSIGKESVEGSLTVEMKGSGTIDIPPEFSDLLEAAIGKMTIVSDTINDIHTITFAPDNADLPSLAIAIWRGNKEKFLYTGLKVSKWEIPLEQGKIITLKTDFKGAILQDIIQESCPLTPAFDATPPLVAKKIIFKIGDIKKEVINATISGENTVEEDEYITTDGIGAITFNGRKILIDFEMLYEDKSIIESFKNGTEAEFEIVVGTQNYNRFTIKLPKVVYVDVPFKKEKGRYSNNIKAQAFPSTGDDEISIVFD